MSDTDYVMLKEGKAMNLDGTQGIQPLQPTSGVNRVQKINTNVYNPAENSIKTNVSRDQEHLNGYEMSKQKQRVQNVRSDGSDDMELDEEMDLFKEQISEELKKMNDRLTNKNINLEFKMHQRTHRIYVEMVDKTTKKVVKEIPSKKMLDMIGRIWDEMGIAVDKKG